ncbi:kinesin-1 heavy chain [Drosophila elegans]|uniref:kinesin-1 heavy chain n=1 Tax=Drosophila elegans TaxID=30023 RepID=UPI0007E85E24|nr:kinesin-1 heavy chain [Drosophila elegans]
MAENTEYTDEGGEYEDDENQYLGEQHMMEEGPDEDLFSKLGESSDDPEQTRMYMEYLALIKEIDCQNKIIQDIKSNIMDMCAKPCKTRNELREIKRLRICMEQENIKLHTMMNRAVQLQNFGSHRHYKELPMTTTVDEDNLSPYMCGIGPCAPAGSGTDPCADEASSCASVCGGGAGGGQRDMAGQDDKLICALQKAMQKMKGACPEDKKMIEEIACAIMSCKKQPVCSPGPCPKPPCPPEESSSSSMGPPCAPPPKKKPCPMPPAAPSPGKCESMEKLKRRIQSMQASVKKLLQEVSNRDGPEPCPDYQDDDDGEAEAEEAASPCSRPCPPRPPCPEDPDPLVICGGKRNTKADKYEKMKENYTRLLTEFQRKDCQMKELQKRMKGICGPCPSKGGDGDADAAELNLLRARVNELKEEQLEFKCIMKEQSQQLEDYRNKYLLAQQKVEEQCVSLEKLNMNNKRIEQQINTEVKEIRAKFQEKLNELLHFPKLLENEQLKLAQVCKEKDEMQTKLVVVCKELKACKAQLEQPSIDVRPQLAQCQMELTQARNELEELLRQRDLFCEQLKSTQDDLDTLRTESAKIIAGTKERAELIKSQQQEQINRLEKELAQCRATASLSVNDREAVIREMQGQLNTLSYSFDAAQKQIKTLRNHIAYVSNENCFPVKC